MYSLDILRAGWFYNDRAMEKIWPFIAKQEIKALTKKSPDYIAHTDRPT